MPKPFILLLLMLTLAGCVIITEIRDCSNLPYEKEKNACYQDNAYIYAVKGQVSSAVSECAQITDIDKKNRDQCYFDVASISKNATVCYSISDDNLRSDCSVHVSNIVNCVYSNNQCS